MRAIDRLPLEKSGEAAIDIIKAVKRLENQVIHINVRNEGVISGIPSDVFVEVPVRVSKGKVEPLPVSLSDKLKRLALPVRMEKMERALEA